MDNKNLLTCEEAADCIQLLRAATRPIVAADIARRLHLSGSRETQRRHVRAIIKHLRDNGSKIVATLQGGYMITDDDGIWAEYLDGRQIDAKRVLAVTHKSKKMLADKNGQGFLFSVRVPLGVASMGVA